MKNQPDPDAIHATRDPRHPEDRDAFPALQLYAAGSQSPPPRHDHILRAALLADRRIFTVPGIRQD